MRPQDRRAAQRYSPAVERARVGWWVAGQFQTTSARLIDISVGGAALAIEGAAPETGALWVCIAGSDPTDWVRAEIAGISAAAEDPNTETEDEAAETEDEARGARIFRLAFAEICPYDIFKAAAWGNPAPRRAPPPSDAPEAAEPAAPASHMPTSPRGEEQAAATAERIGEAPEFAVFEPAPTLVEAERSHRKARDRAAVLPWAVAMMMSLAAIALLGILVIERMDQFRLVASFLETVRR